MQRNNKRSAQPELSDVWQALMGECTQETSETPSEEPIPTLEIDPWSDLSHTKGTESVDLQKLHLQMSDQEVEQLLKRIQEQRSK